METKTCTKCGVEKVLSEFGKQKGGRLGVKSRCNSCENIDNRIYRENNPGYYADYYAKNLEKEKARSKKYRMLNKEGGYTRATNWRKENPDKFKAINDKSRAKRKEKLNTNYRLQRENLDPWYVKFLLKEEGFTTQMINQHPELVNAKKIIIQIKRLVKNNGTSTQ